MTFRWEKAAVAGKELRVYVGVPQRKVPLPAVVIAHHGPGLDEQMQDVAHRLHREGYAVAVPDLFHRQPAGTEMMARIGMLRDEEIVADMNACVAMLKAKDIPVTRFGVTGFCMGGRVTYLMACANPEFRAAAVFYGGGIMKQWGDGPAPFARSDSIQCPMIGFFGEQDTNPSPEDVRKIDAELTRLGKWHEFHMYKDTHHAFQNFLNPDRYRERAARASWEELLAFFTETLKR
jgi:carboxymethylenebutenolidase